MAKSLPTPPWLMLIIGIMVTPAHHLAAGDWPTFRYDAGRTASSPHALPEELRLQWIRAYTPRKTAWDDPLNQDLMKYDRVFEPVVSGGTLFIGFNDSDKVVALDTRTGVEKWRVYVDGPVRFPPATANGKVYFVSDDGFLYCVDLATGAEVWKFRGGPSDRRLLGNERLISSWPARGAPVLRDGLVYFAASIWPFMGTFVYALDAESGAVRWVNDGAGADFIKQPHNHPAFAGIAPQGVLVATEDKLILPGGRSVPAVMDRATGQMEYFHLALYGKAGGSWSFADETLFFGHERDDGYIAFDIQTGKALGKSIGKQPVLSDDGYYFAGDSITGRPLDTPGKPVWEIGADAGGDLIRAGNRLYAGGKNAITVIQLPAEMDGAGDSKQPRIVNRIEPDGDIKRLIAADDRLFAVTLDGRILAFGADDVERPKVFENAPVKRPLKPGAERRASATLDGMADLGGYAVVYDVKDDDQLEALARQSELTIVGLSPDLQTVAALRRRLDDAGLYGHRVAVHVGAIENFDVPPYLSSLTVGARVEGFDVVERIFKSLRPFGGRAWLSGDAGENRRAIEAATLDGGEYSEVRGRGVLHRLGPLTGAGDWTHQYGNIRNTIKSDDALVKLPLGVLWFGGSSNTDVLPRHGHGPPEQVIGGRLYIQGMDSLSARDV
ncbi:MAG: PQQ-binding-like beta-propeller repeat protein, partial [Planctomycetota bacterium]